MTFQISRYFVYLTVLFLPIQTLKHFWPSFSLVSGIRVDYISPALYLTDALLLGAIIFYIISRIQSRRFFVTKKTLLLILCITFLLVLPFVEAQYPLLHACGILRFLLYAGFGFVVSRVVTGTYLKKLALMFVIGGVFSSAIAFLQFFLQTSLGLELLGEPIVNHSIIGVAKMNIGGELLLRPYGTFPHPNVLAFYLLVCVLMGMSLHSFPGSKKHRLLIFFASLVILLGLLITFSRVAIVLAFASLVVLAMGSRAQRKGALIIALGLTTVVPLIGIFSQRFFGSGQLLEALVPRFELNRIAVQMINEHLLTGMGFGNYFHTQIAYQAEVSSVFLQPVHNILLLILLQGGIFSLIAILIFLQNTFRRIFVNTSGVYKVVLLLILASGLLIGMTDHFFLTLHQGQLLSAVVLGICWRRTSYSG